MTKITVGLLALLTCLSGLPLMVGLTGCTGDRYNQGTDQRIDDGRTAQRVREALAAAPEYKFDGVQVASSGGVIQLRGFVNTGEQKKAAGGIASRVAGVQDVMNAISVKE